MSSRRRKRQRKRKILESLCIRSMILSAALLVIINMADYLQLGTKVLRICAGIQQTAVSFGRSVGDVTETWKQKHQTEEEDIADTEESLDEVSETESETAEEAVSVIHEYKLIADPDIETYEQAKEAAEEAGGYLAVITSEEEWEAVVEIAEQGPDVKYIWLGAQAQSDGSFAWNNGEAFTFSCWREGEPSHKDTDGIPENYLSMWYVDSDGAWSWNDQRNNIAEAFPSAHGKIGYMVEYETDDRA